MAVSLWRTGCVLKITALVFRKTGFVFTHISHEGSYVLMSLNAHVTVNHDKFLVIKPTRCTDFSNLFLEWNSTCFGQFLCPSSGVFHCKHRNGICHTGLQTAWDQDQDVPSWSCSQAVSKPVWHIILLCVQWKNSWWWAEELSETCRVSFPE